MDKPETREIPLQKILETVGKLHVQLADCNEQNKQLMQQNQNLAAELRSALEKLSVFQSTGNETGQQPTGNAGLAS